MLLKPKRNINPRYRPAFYIIREVLRCLEQGGVPNFTGATPVMKPKEQRALACRAHSYLSLHYHRMLGHKSALGRKVRLEHKVSFAHVDLVARQYGLDPKELIGVYRATSGGTLRVEEVFNCTADYNGRLKRAIAAVNAALSQMGIVVPETMAHLLIELSKQTR